jgi:hypothetical protein
MRSTNIHHSLVNSSSPALIRPLISRPAFRKAEIDVASASPTCASGTIKIRLITMLLTSAITPTRTGVRVSWREKNAEARILIDMKASRPAAKDCTARAVGTTDSTPNSPR